MSIYCSFGGMDIVTGGWCVYECGEAVSSEDGRLCDPGGCERCWCLVRVVLRQKLDPFRLGEALDQDGRHPPAFATRLLADVGALSRMDAPVTSETGGLETPQCQWCRPDVGEDAHIGKGFLAAFVVTDMRFFARVGS